jgi:hypothetical protein
LTCPPFLIKTEFGGDQEVHLLFRGLVKAEKDAAYQSPLKLRDKLASNAADEL